MNTYTVAELLEKLSSANVETQMLAPIRVNQSWWLSVDVWLLIHALQEAVEVLKFYGYVNNHKLWDGEIMKLDKGKQASQLLAKWGYTK